MGNLGSCNIESCEKFANAKVKEYASDLYKQKMGKEELKQLETAQEKFKKLLTDLKEAKKSSEALDKKYKELMYKRGDISLVNVAEFGKRRKQRRSKKQRSKSKSKKQVKKQRRSTKRR